MFAIYEKTQNEFIGTVKIGHIDWRSGVGDLGIMIGSKNAQGKGFAKESVKLACEYAFCWIGLRKLTGGTFADNIPMIKCFEKTGFVLEGVKRKELFVDGEYMDHHLFGFFRDEYLAMKIVG
jgi:RimJ/RimL family protein N-acetyltransferase